MVLDDAALQDILARVQAALSVVVAWHHWLLAAAAFKAAPSWRGK